MAAKNGLEPPEREQLTQQVAVLQKVAKAQSAARNLREQAKKITNPKERERILREAYAKEVEAHGQSKLAQRMQSGVWQGAAGGAGIGAGTGLGLGAVVGTLVGGLVSVPTTGLGALIGTGVGAIHGPWFTFGGGSHSWEDAKPEEVVDALKNAPAGTTERSGNPELPPTRKRPRKIQIRSSESVECTQNAPVPTESTHVDARKDEEAIVRLEAHDVDAASFNPPRLPSHRKPRKIQIRSPRQESDLSNDNAGT